MTNSFEFGPCGPQQELAEIHAAAELVYESTFPTEPVHDQGNYVTASGKLRDIIETRRGATFRADGMNCQTLS